MGKRVLVVDDDRLIREMVRDSLADEGYRVVLAASGPEALDRLRDDGSFELVITDLSMPIMDGIELTRILRSLDQEIPIICCTGFGSESLEKEALASGVSAFARKPLRVEDFGRLLRQAIDQKLPARTTSSTGI